MAALDDFTALVGLDVPDCPDPVVQYHVITSAQEYCARTVVWQADLEPEVVTPSEPTIDLTATGGIVDRPLILLVDGKEITVVPPSVLAEDGMDQTGVPAYYRYISETTVQLYPIPTSNVTVTGLLALKPKAKGPIPQWLYDSETHREGILAGALARIYRIPKKSWTDYDQATAMAGVFKDKISRGAARGHRGKTTRIKALVL